MTRIVLQSKTGPDGTLHLNVPLGRPDTEFEVEVVVNPKATQPRGWPPGYFDLFGSIDDETFFRQPQGALPPPVEIE
ncbi:MAG: hypothetical protein ACLQNE_14925 [Thermoguttaceae bacterium]